MNIVADILMSDRGVERLSDWLTVDQPMIDAFAEATFDHQFIHVDPVRAADTPFGGTVAHGFLTLSLLTVLHETTPQPPLPPARMSVNYGCERLRLITPVRSGSRIRLRSTLADFEDKGGGQFQLSHDLVIEIEHLDRPALSARWLSRMFF